MIMSSIPSKTSDSIIPNWFADLLGMPAKPLDNEIILNGVKLKLSGGILRADTLMSKEQAQTEEVFGFKWHKRDTFESKASQKLMKNWSIQRYGDVSEWLPKKNGPYTILDAGCGAAHTSRLYFDSILNSIKYIGADISNAVDVAKLRLEEQNVNSAFLQCDLINLPIPNECLDVIFSEGVLHHTDSTRNALLSLAPLLKSGGLFMFYVYRKKGPIREFTDDHIRQILQSVSNEEAWRLLEPITKLGKVLGELDLEIDIPDRIDLLDIEAGKINIQRLFYWHVLKCFYRPDFSLDEMNHINFDWFAPKNAFRQTPEEVRGWCNEADLKIEREKIEEAGITIVARKSQ